MRFFSDNGINLLIFAINVAGSIRDISIYEFCANVLLEGYEATVVNLKKAYDDVVVGLKDARDTSERWSGVRSVESSEVGKASCWAASHKSDVVEVGQVKYLSEFMLAPDQPCSSGTTMAPRSPGKRKRKKRATPAPTATPERLFDFDDESIILPKGRGVYFDNPNFECALKSRGKLLRLVEVVVAVVLHLFFSQVPVNFIYQ